MIRQTSEEKRHCSDNQPILAVRTAQDEVISGEIGHVESIQPKALLERMLERENLSDEPSARHS